MRRYLVILISVTLISTSVGMSPASANGLLDISFDTDGKVTTAIGSSTDEIRSVAIQSDGKIVAMGNTYTGSKYNFALTRYNIDGSLDTSFGTAGKVTTSIGTVDDYARSMKIQSDGKIVVAGFSWNGSKYNFVLTRYNIDGSLDTSFDTDGKVITAIRSGGDYATSIAIQSDGKIVVAGSSANGGKVDFALARYNSDGTLDSSFDTDGKVTSTIGSGTDEIRSIAIQSDGKIVVAGVSSNGSNNDFALARYNIDGSLDSSFSTDGKVTTAIGSYSDEIRSVAIQGDGKIVAGGISFDGIMIGSNIDFALARYNSDGSLDSSFDTDGKVVTPIGSSYDQLNSIAIQSSGKIVAVGAAYNGTHFDFALARYNIDGSLDVSFDADGKVITTTGSSSVFLSVAIQGDGRLIAAGSSTNGSKVDFALARYGVPVVVAVDSAVSAAVSAAAAAAEAARREAERKVARIEIASKFEAAEKVTIEVFRQADIVVSLDDFDEVVEEILALPEALRADIAQVIKVAYKYEVVGKLSSDMVKTVYPKDLIAIGLIPADSRYKATLTAILQKLPTSLRSDYFAIKASLDAAMKKIEARNLRLVELRSRSAR